MYHIMWQPGVKPDHRPEIFQKPRWPLKSLHSVFQQSLFIHHHLTCIVRAIMAVSLYITILPVLWRRWWLSPHTSPSYLYCEGDDGCLLIHHHLTCIVKAMMVVSSYITILPVLRRRWWLSPHTLPSYLYCEGDDGCLLIHHHLTCIVKAMMAALFFWLGEKVGKWVMRTARHDTGGRSSHKGSRMFSLQSLASMYMVPLPSHSNTGWDSWDRHQTKTRTLNTMNILVTLLVQ